MGVSGAHAHVVAGVLIQDHLEVTSGKENRPVFDTDTGQQKGEVEVTQYTYTIFGRKMPIVEEVYPQDLCGKVNKRFGYNMQLNFHRWLESTGMLNEDGERNAGLTCQHSSYASWPVQHPRGPIGVQLHRCADLDLHDGQHIPLELTEESLQLLKTEAFEKLRHAGWQGDKVRIYVIAGCG
jgi:hypothetical protein